MRKSAEIIIEWHMPSTDAGKAELARKVGEFHGTSVQYCVQHLDCPEQQKQALIEALIADEKGLRT